MPKIKDVAANNAKFGPDRLRIPAPRALVGIDPGDKHVGIAWFAEDDFGYPVCEWAAEYTPEEGINFLVRQISAGTVFGIALERFNLYEDKASAKIGSDFPTIEMIGVIKYLVKVNNEAAPIPPVSPFDPPWPERIELWLQGADIKKGIRAQIKARELVRASKSTTHAGDAEEHGWYRILRGGDKP